MKNLLLIAIGVLIAPFYSLAQNIAINGNFEFKSQCPNGGGQIHYALPWEAATGSPDYFNWCDGPAYGVPVNMYGYQQERQLQDGYAGIVTWDENEYREIMQGESPGPIFAYTKYYVTAWVNWSDNSPTYCRNLGMTLHASANEPVQLGQIPNMEFIGMEPVDSVGWHKIHGTFEIDFQAQWFRIGNYLRNIDSDTTQVFPVNGGRDFSYLLIDDICISVGSVDCSFPVGIEKPVKKQEFLWEFDGVFWQQVTERKPNKMYKSLYK